MSPRPPTEADLPRRGARGFLLLAAASAVVGVLSFLVMQFFFDREDPVREIVGFAAFLLWLASGAVMIAGLVGALTRALRR